MAKTLEKVSKEYNVLYGKLVDIAHQVQSITKNRTDLENLAGEYARGAAEHAIELKSKGHTGTTFNDFRNEPKVKEFFKLWNKQKTTAAQLLPAAKQTAKDCPVVMAKLEAMIRELKDEIANREKKASRVIFKIKSESLPDLKKLLKEVEKRTADLTDRDFQDDAKDLPDFVAGEFPPFEEEFDSVFKKSRAARQGAEVFEMGQGAKKVRAQLKYMREGKQMEGEIKKLCAEALKAAKQGQSPRPHLDEATKIYRRMHEVTKYQERAKRMEPFQLKTPDGKKVHKLATDYIQLSKDTLTLLTKTTKATMPTDKTKKTPPPVPKRKDKGKEKIDV